MTPSVAIRCKNRLSVARVGAPERPPKDVVPLLLGDQWPSDRPGGLNRYFGELFAALTGIGERPLGVVFGPALARPEGVSAVGPALQALPLRLWRFERATGRLAQDAVVVDAHFALNAVWPVMFGPLRKMPLVTHFQGPWADESAAAGSIHRWHIVAKRQVESAVYRRSSRIIVLTGAFKRLLIERYPVSPWDVVVVPPGVDLERFRPGDRQEARARFDVPERAFVAVSVRRLTMRMGLDVLLNAWSEVKAEHPDAVLLIAGAGTERERLHALAATLQLGESVRFLGRVDDADLVACYQAADVSVVPTVDLEGFGLVVLEALACGTPGVVTDAGGLPEVVGPLDQGCVVPAGNAGALAERLTAAAAGSMPLPDSGICRRYAETFTWDRAARRHRQIYAEAVAPRQSKLRVVYLDHCALLSGAELALLRLLPGLADVDAHVVLAHDGPLVPKLLQAGISTEVLPMAEAARGLTRDQVRPGRLPWRSAARSAAYTLRLTRHLRRLRPDVVHTNSLKAALYGGMAARLAGVPVIWHVRDRIADDYLPLPAVRLIRRLARILPSAVVANSQATLDTLGGSSVPTRVVFSPVGTDLPARAESTRAVISDAVTIGSAAERSEVQLRTGKRAAMQIGVVGRLAPWKGQHLFLTAFAQAFPVGMESGVIVGAPLFGEADYEGLLRQQAGDLGIDARIQFTGFRDDIAAVLASFDVLVHTSVIPEPFGQVVVEAMAMGLPVLAANAGGPAEVIEHGVTGMLYEMGDSVALTAALRQLAADPQLRQELGAAARRRALDFRPAVVAAQVMAVYRDALGDRWPEHVPRPASSECEEKGQ